MDNKTTSLRLNATHLDLIKSCLEQATVMGKDAHYIADCLKKVEKASQKLNIPEGLVLDKNGKIKTKV